MPNKRKLNQDTFDTRKSTSDSQTPVSSGEISLSKPFTYVNSKDLLLNILSGVLRDD